MILKIKDYFDQIALCNNFFFADFSEWLFYNGMLFGSYEKWWGDFGLRSNLHEGIDIAMYKDKYGKTKWFDTNIKIPAMAKGGIINICNDFLGKSLIIEHELSQNKKSRIISVYAHVCVAKNIYIGRKIRKGDIIANVCDTSRKKSNIPCHVHISIMEVKKKISNHFLNWEFFEVNNSDLVKLFNPWI
ncbi:MAG: hypothetical protein B6I26_05335 [Desulfobacteraceae bacterium 4572_130]|nr:MAG: hypothetical protein B6I26_05335 [Desulfobacteraceae bacterium 4572_130]